MKEYSVIFVGGYKIYLWKDSDNYLYLRDGDKSEAETLSKFLNVALYVDDDGMLL